MDPDKGVYSGGQGREARKTGRVVEKSAQNATFNYTKKTAYPQGRELFFYFKCVERRRKKSP